MPTIKIHKSSATNMPIEDNSVHSIITSPPYWAKRIYDGQQRQFWGGELDCVHEWIDGERSGMTGGTKSRKLNSKKIGADGTLNFQAFGKSEFKSCVKCGAWYGALGLEPDIKTYVRNLSVDIGNELKRVLHPTGILWLNLGDGFSVEKNLDNLKPKDLTGVPWRVAFALQEQGWWLRAAIPWLKNSAMPHPVMDRPIISHEYWFMLTKSEKYFYDTYSVLQRKANLNDTKPERLFGGTKYPEKTINPTYSGREYDPNKYDGRRWRTGDIFFQSVNEYLLYLNYIIDNKEGMLLDINGDPLAMIYNPIQYKGAHYAAFNPKMIKPLVLCSTSQHGVCSVCSNPYSRKKYPNHNEWTQTCKHDSTVVPAIVLDPFCGTGSTLFSANKLGRNTIGCDISDKYIDLTQKRLGIDKLEQWKDNSP